MKIPSVEASKIIIKDYHRGEDEDQCNDDNSKTKWNPLGLGLFVEMYILRSGQDLGQFR